MHYQYTQRLSMLAAGLALLSACGGTEDVNSQGSIKLSGPVSTALAALDQSDIPSDGIVGISTILAVFPAAALEDFTNRFPGVVAEEQYRILEYQGGVAGNEVFGIEGEHADGVAEIDAVYSTAGVFISSRTGSPVAQVPAAVSDVLSSLHPDAVIDESEEWRDGNDTLIYEVELESARSEYEVTLDAGGTVLETSEVVSESMVPAAVVSGILQELPSTKSISYTRVTVNGSVTYRVEVETGDEGVDIEYSERGDIVSMTWVQDL